MNEERSNSRGAAGPPVEILFVEPSPYPSYGGSKRVLVNLIQSLDRARWRPSAVFYSAGPWVDELASLGVPVRIAPAEVAGWTAPAQTEAAGVPGLMSVGVRKTAEGEYRLSPPRHALREARFHAHMLWGHRRMSHRLEPLCPGGAALVHFNGPMHAEYAWYHLARRRGVPYLTHEHGGWKAPPGAWRRVAREAAAVLCLTEERVARVRAFAGPGVRARILPNGVSPASFSPRLGPQEVRRALGLVPPAALIITAGHLQKWKGQDLAVEAARVLRDRGRQFLWILCGRELEPDFATGLRRRIAEAGLEAHVRLLGERTDLPDLFAAADVAVHTSVTPEPFGLVVVEAMAAGTPVVGPAEGAIPSIVRDGMDGRLYGPRDAASLTEALDALLGDPVLCGRLGAAARERVQAEFTLDRQARRLAGIYEEILAASR